MPRAETVPRDDDPDATIDRCPIEIGSRGRNGPRGVRMEIADQLRTARTLLAECGEKRCRIDLERPVGRVGDVACLPDFAHLTRRSEEQPAHFPVRRGRRDFNEARTVLA